VVDRGPEDRARERNLANEAYSNRGPSHLNSGEYPNGLFWIDHAQALVRLQDAPKVSTTDFPVGEALGPGAARLTRHKETMMTKQVIAVLGGTGLQGGGVVDALIGGGKFAVRVASRNPASNASQALAARRVEVVKADLLDPSSLRSVLTGAHGAFVVTNFWDPAQRSRETEIDTAAVQAARAVGVKHLIWSTLPDSEKLTGGRLKVAHFTGKARVDAVVKSAGFARHTFVMAAMYFQNFLTMMAPQRLPNGGRGWALPIDPAARVIHAVDATEVGRAVAAAFAAGDRLPDGSYLGVCGGLYSFNDFVSTLNAQGHKVRVLQVSPAEYDGFFPGAYEIREMFQYFAEHTYFGPEHERYIAAANALVPGGLTSFADWARAHMTAV
jgi:uncharacterized protein YbjT (DUF2867 family)